MQDNTANQYVWKLIIWDRYGIKFAFQLKNNSNTDLV